MNGITVQELSAIRKGNQPFQLIDVREEEEHIDFNIGGQLIPMGQIVRHLEMIETDKPVILYCRKGIRSQFAIQMLLEKFPFTNLFNLIGGTEAWKKMVQQENNI